MNHIFPQLSPLPAISSSMATPPSEPLSLRKVLSESERIIRLHQSHFQALAGIFVLPLSICSILYPLIQPKFLQDPHLLPALLWLLFCYIFNLFSVATISYSTYHFYLDETVDLISSIKSIFHSFWPLFSTFLVVFIVHSLISIPFVLLLLLAWTWLQHSSYFIPSAILLLLTLVVLLIYLAVNWALANVTAVVESRWGYAPLQRSAYLMKGNRGVALSTVLHFRQLCVWFFWGYFGGGGSHEGGWRFLFAILGAVYLTLFLPLGYVAITVLYMYCRESQEGLAYEKQVMLSLLTAEA